MADSWRKTETPGKIHFNSPHASFFCVFFATFFIWHFQARAQTVSPANAPAPVPFALAPPPTTPAVDTVLATSATPAEPRFLLDGAIDLSEGYTTNAGGQQNGSRNPSSFTRGEADVGLHYKGPRLVADWNSSLSGYYYADAHDQNQLSNQLNLATKSVVVPDHLFFNANAFAAPISLSRVGSLSANQASVSNSNNRQSYGYVAEPIYTMRLGDYAVSQTSLSQNSLFVGQPFTASTGTVVPVAPDQTTRSTTVSEQISSSPYFGPLSWNLTGSYADTNQTAQDTTHTNQSQQQTKGIVDLTYAVDRSFAVLGTAGYNDFESSVPLTKNVSGPTALAGVRFTYGPTFNLVAQAGVSNNFPTYRGSLYWSVTPTFSINGSLTDSISTPQGDVLNNLATLAASADGTFFNSQSFYWQTQQQALSPQFATVSPVPTLGLALDNSINRDRNAQLGFVHQDERTQYGVSFFGDVRDRLDVITDGSSPRSWLYGVRLNASRQFRHDLTGYSGVSYSVASEFGGQDRIITVSGGLNYAMAKDLDCYVTAQYLQRQSSGQIILTQNVPLSDLVTIVGIRRRFGH